VTLRQQRDIEPDEWAPITDDDLLVEAPPPPVLEPPEPQPAPPELAMLAPWPVMNEAPPAKKVTTPPPIKKRRKKKPVERKQRFPMTPWGQFLYFLMRDRSCTIDQAAQLAGLPVYESLVKLRDTNPWIYDSVVMRGPQGSVYGHKRRRGFRPRLDGWMGKEASLRSPAGLPEHHERVYGDAPGCAGKRTPEQARAEFLALLGDHHQSERVDGGPQKGLTCQSLLEPAPGVKLDKVPKKWLHLSAAHRAQLQRARQKGREDHPNG